MAEHVAGDKTFLQAYYNIEGQLGEIKRQLRQRGGYPYDLNTLGVALQAIIEGEFESGYQKAYNMLIDYNIHPQELFDQSSFNHMSGVVRPLLQGDFSSVEYGDEIPKGSREIQAKLKPVQERLDVANIMASLSANCLRPAIWFELLAFAAKYQFLPDKDCYIIAPGTMINFDGEQIVPAIYTDTKGRRCFDFCSLPRRVTHIMLLAIVPSD